MNTWFVVEDECIDHCITTRERLTQPCFGNTTRRCHAALNILHKNVLGSCDSFLNGLESGHVVDAKLKRRICRVNQEDAFQFHGARRRPKSPPDSDASKMVVRARLGSGRTASFR